MAKLHEVTIDVVRNCERYTCVSRIHGEDNLVRQPWITDEKWRELTENFINKRHPCALIKDNRPKATAPLA